MVVYSFDNGFTWDCWTNFKTHREAKKFVKNNNLELYRIEKMA